MSNGSFNAAIATDPVKEYRLEEYRFLHDEVMKRLERQTSLEIYTVLSCAAVYGFLLSGYDSQMSKDMAPFVTLGWWLPFLLVLIGFSRWQTNSTMLGRVGSYLKEHHEKHVRQFDANYKGWSTFNTEKSGGREPRVTLAIWCVVLLLTFIVALLRTWWLLPGDGASGVQPS